jgi:hypothetical protein
MTEGLAELVFFRKQPETAPLNGQRRIKNQISVAHEHSSSYFALHRRYKTGCAGVKMKRCGVALQGEVFDRDRLAAQSDVAQLLICEIGVGNGRSSVLSRKGGRDDEHTHECIEMHKPRRRRHEAASFLGEGGMRNYLQIRKKQGFLVRRQKPGGQASRRARPAEQSLFSLRLERGVNIHAPARGLELSLQRLEARLADCERVIAGRHVNFGRRIADEASVQRNVRIHGCRGDGDFARDRSRCQLIVDGNELSRLFLGRSLVSSRRPILGNGLARIFD